MKQYALKKLECVLCKREVDKFSNPPVATCDDCRRKCKKDGHPMDKTNAGWRIILKEDGETEKMVSCVCGMVEKPAKEWIRP